MAVAGGLFLLALGVPRERSWLPSLVALAPATGIAFVGVTTTVGAMAGVDVGLTSAAVLCALLLTVTSSLIRRRGTSGGLAPRTAGYSGRVLEITLMLVYAGLALAIVRLAAVSNLFAWDGWAIWAAKANALYHDGDVWSPVFREPEYVLQHLEYPVLMPSLEALSAEALGRFDPNLIDIEASIVLVAYGLAIWGVLRLLIPRGAAAAVALGLTGSAPLTVNAVANYADTVVAVFTALGLLMVLVWLARDGTAWLAVGTLFLAACALTKSEGLLFAVAAILSALALASRFGRSRRLAAVSGVMCLFPAAAWSVVDRVNGPGADNVDLGRILQPAAFMDRFLRAVDSMATELAVDWPVATLAVTVALLAAASTRTWRPAAFMLLWIGLALGGLVLVYAVSTNPIDWHLATSADRVIFSIALGGATMAPVVAALALEAARRTNASGSPAPRLRGSAEAGG